MLKRLLAVIVSVVLLGAGLVIPAKAETGITVEIHATSVPGGCSWQSDSDSVMTRLFEDAEGTGVYSTTINLVCGESTNLMYRFNVSDPEVTDIYFEFPDAKLQDFSGVADFSFEECLGSISFNMEWVFDQYSDTNGTFTVESSGTAVINPSAEDGSYSFKAPVGVNVGIGGSSSGGVDSSMCELQYTQQFKFKETDTSYNIKSDVAYLNYTLVEPDGKQGKCRIVDNYSGTEGSLSYRYLQLSQLYSIVETVQCEGFSRQLVGEIDQAVRGQTSQVTVTVPDYELLAVSGEVNMNYEPCLTDLVVEASSPEGYYFNGLTVNADGTFSGQMPKGTWSFNAYHPTLPYSICSASKTAFIGGSAGETEIVIDSKNVRVQPVLLQPAGRSDCVIGDPEDTETDYSVLGVPMGAKSFVIRVTCGEYNRMVRATLPAELSATEINQVSVQVPPISMRKVSGSFSVPSGFKSTYRSNVRVELGAYADSNDFAQTGWVKGSGNYATLNWSNMTYSLTLPVGQYSLAAMAWDAKPTTGCYPKAHYVANKAPVVSDQFATLLTVSSGSGTQSLPKATLVNGAYINTTYTWPDDAPTGYMTLDLFSESKQAFLFRFGDGVASWVGEYAYMLCLTPGKYYLRASGDQVASQFYGPSATVSSAKLINVYSNGTTDKVHFDFFKRQNASISGQLVDTAGDPVTDFTIYAYSSSGLFASAPVDSEGNFKLRNLEGHAVYSLVAANDLEFNYLGTGGTKYAFYGSAHTEADSSLISLDGATSSVDNLKFVYVPADEDATPDQVVPWNRFAAPNAPVSSLSELQDLIDAGTAKVDSSYIVAADTTTLNAQDATASFSGLEDATVDLYVVSPEIALTPASVRAAEVTPGPKYLGKFSIVDDKVTLPEGIPVVKGTNYLVIVGSDSSTTRTLPVVVGAQAPKLAKKYALSGSAKVGKTVSAGSGIWVSNPKSVTLKYKWYRCSSPSSGCKTIAGASKSSYKATRSDKGKYLKVAVTAKNSVGSTSTSLVTGKVR